MLRRAILVFVPVAAVFVLCLFFGLSSSHSGWLGSGARPNEAVLLRQVQALSQLVTVKYVLEKVIDVRDVKWYGDNRVLLVADGVVKAGVQLDEIKLPDIQIADRSITLVLPPATITDAYLDDHNTRVLERDTGVMRVFDKDLEQKARQEAVEDIRAAARENGILQDAETQAKAQLSNFLYQAGFTNVVFQTHIVLPSH